jgi:hypothetical protein
LFRDFGDWVPPWHHFWGVSLLWRGSRLINVTPGFKDKPECKNTCAPGSSYTHASTQWIPKHSVKA